MAIPNAPPVVFVTASQDSAIAVTALKAGAADYLVKDTQGDFIPLLQVAVNGALRQAELQRARDEAEAEVHASRDRYAALAAEREVLLREVNHRVGNSLQIIASLLHLQASSAAQDDVKAALTNAMGRVAAVAQVHRRLYTSHDLKSVSGTLGATDVRAAAEVLERACANGSGAPEIDALFATVVGRLDPVIPRLRALETAPARADALH